MKITVIIPCYNAEAYIWSCLESVRQQNYNDLEIVIINDGSTDQTAKIIEEWIEDNPLPLTVSNTANNGSAAARNMALQNSNGEYIQFLDADDQLLPDKLSHQVSLLKKQKKLPDFIAAAYRNESFGGYSHSFLPDDRDPWFGLISSNLGITSANLFKKSSLQKINGFDTTLNSSQEYDLMFRLMKIRNCEVLIDSEIKTLKREVNPNAISASNLEKNLIQFIKLRQEMKDYLESSNQFSNELQDHWHQVIFHSIKRLFNYNRGKSKELFDLLLPKNFVPKISGAVNTKYRFLYQTMGFTVTQWLFYFKNRLEGQ